MINETDCMARKLQQLGRQHIENVSNFQAFIYILDICFTPFYLIYNFYFLLRSLLWYNNLTIELIVENLFSFF
jgi:hypothetical protein